ncbi:type II toxin-antitoxin system toxin DNA ADP-ribosyl transferase DarT [Pedobacter sp.]|uniref:type II toxin-antitoxin system toxin DNA ADP-ribosyl transferase DarT n=1 Tax=Pedobacter sp. TaxID=1411316 RepID=UPI003D7FF126
MASQDLSKIWLFRIIHIDNLEYSLKYGMFHKNHVNADPNYINIGDSGLIEQRSSYNVGINPPNGLLGEYIPFYFGPLSPMLLNIKTGYRGVKQRPQQDIVYICCDISSIISNCDLWCFTDGHAKNALTMFYNNIENIGNINIQLANERYWINTDQDLDKMRKKQAEFLVKFHVPAKCISNIVVYNEMSKDRVDQIIRNLNMDIKVHINPSNKYYY